MLKTKANTIEKRINTKPTKAAKNEPKNGIQDKTVTAGDKNKYIPNAIKINPIYLHILTFCANCPY